MSQKTINEAARKSYSFLGEILPIVDSYTEAQTLKNNIFRSGAEFAQRWIPVEEKLPESNIPVLVKDCFGAYRVAFCIGSLNSWSYNNIADGKVTHWRLIEVK